MSALRSTLLVAALVALFTFGVVVLLWMQSVDCRARGGHLRNTGTVVMICVSADGRILE